MSLKSDLIVQVAVPIATALVEQLLTKENCQQAGDRLIDALEDLVTQSDSPTLKAMALPALQAIRTVAGIPDFPDAKVSNAPDPDSSMLKVMSKDDVGPGYLPNQKAWYGARSAAEEDDCK